MTRKRYGASLWRRSCALRACRGGDTPTIAIRAGGRTSARRCGRSACCAREPNILGDARSWANVDALRTASDQTGLRALISIDAPNPNRAFSDSAIIMQDDYNLRDIRMPIDMPKPSRPRKETNRLRCEGRTRNIMLEHSQEREDSRNRRLKIRAATLCSLSAIWRRRRLTTILGAGAFQNAVAQYALRKTTIAIRLG